MLDIGCSDPTFLNLLKKKKNLDLFAIDPSSENLKKFKEKNINLIVDYFSKKRSIDI